jgi:general secretion pathway protein M
MNLSADMVASPKLVLSGIALAALLIVGALVAAITSIFSEQNQQIRETLWQLANVHADVASRPALQAELDDVRRKAASLPGLYTAANDALAGAQMESDVKAIVDGNGGEVRSAQILTPARKDGFEALGVQYDLTVPQSHLRRLLYAIETHTPYLLIDEADISASPDAQPQNPDPQIEIRWTVHAYRGSAAK